MRWIWDYTDGILQYGRVPQYGTGNEIAYSPIISRTTLSAILTAPTSTSMLKINSPIYAQTIVTALALPSTTGGEAANTEKMMQASTMIAPSRQTAAYPLRKALPMLCVGSPAKEAKGIGAIAV
jgi:hypothetical protein